MSILLQKKNVGDYSYMSSPNIYYRAFLCDNDIHRQLDTTIGTKHMVPPETAIGEFTSITAYYTSILLLTYFYKYYRIQKCNLRDLFNALLYSLIIITSIYKCPRLACLHKQLTAYTHIYYPEIYIPLRCLYIHVSLLFCKRRSSYGYCKSQL